MKKFGIAQALVAFVLLLALTGCMTAEDSERRDRQEIRIKQVVSETCVDIGRNNLACEITLPSGLRCVVISDFDSSAITCDWRNE